MATVLAACGATSAMSRSGRPRPAEAAAPAPRTVLVLSETRGYHHASIPVAVSAVRRVAERDGRFRVVALSGAAQLTPAALRHAAAVVFLLTSGELPLSSAQRTALLAFVRAGGGLAGFHSATDTFHRWPAWIALIGAEFSHHAAPSSEPLVVETPRSPLTRGLPVRFRLFEEYYVFTRDPRPHVHVLLRIATPGDRPDRPLAWCRRSGRGRVFYDALGHFPQTWSDARQLALVRNGIAWAAGVLAAPGC